MKRIFWTVLFFALLVFVSIGQAEEQKPQTYDFVITVEYHGLTLKEISDKEKKIREVFHDANKRRVEFEQSCPSCNYGWGNNLIFNQDTTTVTPN
jgi:hypothetical protein